MWDFTTANKTLRSDPKRDGYGSRDRSIGNLARSGHIRLLTAPERFCTLLGRLYSRQIIRMGHSFLENWNVFLVHVVRNIDKSTPLEILTIPWHTASKPFYTQTTTERTKERKNERKMQERQDGVPVSKWEEKSQTQPKKDFENMAGNEKMLTWIEVCCHPAALQTVYISRK